MGEVFCLSEKLFLLAVEGGHKNFYGYYQVARFALFLVDGEALAFEAQAAVGWGARFYCGLNLAVEGGDIHLATKQKGEYVDSRCGKQVVALAGEGAVALHPEGYVEVASAAVGCRGAVASQTYLLPIGYACGYGYSYVLAVYGECLAVGDGSLAQGYGEGGLQVAVLVAAVAAHSAEKLLEKVAETACVLAAAAKVAPPAKAAPLPPSALLAAARFKFVGLFPVLAILVIFFSFLGVTQNLVGLVYRLETLLGLWVVFVCIGVILFCQPSVGFLYVALFCIALHTKHFVVIYKCHILCFFGNKTSCCARLFMLFVA